MIKKTIVILANSIKNNGRCLAGKDIFTGEWMRIVGDAKGRELIYKDDIRYRNVHGEYGLQNIHPLQKIEVCLKEKVLFFKHQPENWIYCNQQIWIQHFKMQKDELVFL